MRLATSRIRSMARARGMTLGTLLEQAGVSRTAYYSLARRPSILPRSELFDLVVHMHGWGPFEQEVTRAIKIRLGDVEIPVLPLDRIIASKKATGRPKDRAILPALEDTLRTLRSRHKRNG